MDVPLSFNRMRLLVIEDQPETGQMISCMLKEIGFEDVTVTDDGLKGLDTILYALKPIDAVLCDWNLPSVKGIEILRRLREVDLKMPFLMVTGRADEPSVKEARSAGVSAYIHKPFSVDQLEAKLRILHQKHFMLPPSIHDTSAA